MRSLSFKTDMIIAESEVVAEVDQSHVGAWALELTLLLEHLAESLLVRSPEGRSILFSLQHEKQQRPATRTVVTRVDPARLEFHLSRTQAEYLQAFLLKAYRDSMAEVNHVHIEGTLSGSSFDLTLLFKVSRPPMTPEEAARLLQG